MRIASEDGAALAPAITARCRYPRRSLAKSTCCENPGWVHRHADKMAPRVLLDCAPSVPQGGWRALWNARGLQPGANRL